MNHVTLRGLIVSQYDTLQRFANALGWSERKVSYIVSGKQDPTASDIEIMADKLHISIPDDMQHIFFDN